MRRVECYLDACLAACFVALHPALYTMRPWFRLQNSVLGVGLAGLGIDYSFADLGVLLRQLERRDASLWMEIGREEEGGWLAG
jgi:hypothetical protein